jgi:hypothetical protein
MFAYAPDGTPIEGTLESQTGTAVAQQGTFKRLADGTIDCEFTGDTEWDDNSQREVERDGETIYVDVGGDEWPASQIVLRETELAEGEELDPSEIPAAPVDQGGFLRTYTIEFPKDGARTVDSFTPQEKAKLRPIAETLAIMDGNAFFGATRDENGDDTFYEQYLPEAAALVASSSGATSASFMRGKDEPVGFPFPVDPVEFYEGQRVHDFIEEGFEGRQLFLLSDIKWDASDDDVIQVPAEESVTGEAKTLTPHLPTSLVVAVEADFDPEMDEPSFADRLSDRFGFCIFGLSYDSLPTPVAGASEQPADGRGLIDIALGDPNPNFFRIYDIEWELFDAAPDASLRRETFIAVPASCSPGDVDFAEELNSCFGHAVRDFKVEPAPPMERAA